MTWNIGFSQNEELSIHSLKHSLGMAKDDTSRILEMALLCHDYAYSNYDSSIVYGQRALELLKRNDFPRGKARVFFGLGCAYFVHGDIAKAMDTQLKGLQVAAKKHAELEKSACLMLIGFCYHALTDNQKAIGFFKRARHANKRAKQMAGFEFIAPEIEVNLGLAYMDNKQLDSAQVCLQNLAAAPLNATWRAVALQSLSEVFILKEKYRMALECLNESLDIDIKNNDKYSLTWAYISLSRLYQKMGQADSCISYAQKGFGMAQRLNVKLGLLKSSQILTQQLEKTNPIEAIKYHQSYEKAYEDLYGGDKIVSLQKTLLQEQERQRKLESDRLAYQNKVKQYGFLAGLAILFLIALILYRNNQKEKEARNLVNQQKEEIQAALSNLKSTQAQLIQSEKLASLGELTAGIAHEIQNPLNFVNNFAEVSAEMIGEMEEELAKGGTSEAIAIATELKQNLSKINHHGQRASSIVKGMLEHSRASTGVKEPTDLNALADEYLRLAYHGLRAKDNNFNATLETHFDPDLPMVSMIPQDIGRVLLNLINNAFYAVHQRVDAQPTGTREGRPYEPTVTVSTKRLENAIEICVQDNGNGIPEAIKDKIFQPFFTTKPTGQGTGLGLSLAYDIVTKGHGGKMEVQSEEGDGTEFVIQLPTKKNG